MKRQTWISLSLTVAVMTVGAIVSARAASAQQTGAALRDDANGYLCFDFRAWGDCFPYTPTARGMTASPTARPTDIPPTQTPSPIPPTAPPTLRPTATATQAPPVVNVVNPGFENGLTGWTQFTLAGSAELNSERISTGADPLAVHSGDASARLIAHYACYRAGVYQVIGVPVDAHIRISAWVMTLGSRENGLHAPHPEMNSYIGLGVDPLGLTSAGVSRIEWARITGGQLVGAIHGLDPSWQLIQLETITTRPTLTVFVYGDLGKTQDGACMWAYMNLLAFIDDVAVEVIP